MIGKLTKRRYRANKPSFKKGRRMKIILSLSFKYERFKLYMYVIFTNTYILNFILPFEYINVDKEKVQ